MRQVMHTFQRRPQLGIVPEAGIVEFDAPISTSQIGQSIACLSERLPVPIDPRPFFHRRPHVVPNPGDPFIAAIIVIEELRYPFFHFRNLTLQRAAVGNIMLARELRRVVAGPPTEHQKLGERVGAQTVLTGIISLTGSTLA